LGIAKFAEPQYRKKYILIGFAAPVILHGIYDFILFSQKFYMLFFFLPFMLYLWKSGLRHVDELVAFSPFRKAEEEYSDAKEKDEN
jgi:protease PrsW